VERFKLIPKATDFDGFVRVLSEAHERLPILVLPYYIHSNHWNLVLPPKKGVDLSEFIRWLTLTYAQRWPACHHTQVTGALGAP
jgi:hypothetical protein